MQDLELPGDIPPPGFGTITTDPGAGIVFDTTAAPDNRFGVAQADIFSTDEADSPRLEPGKIYRARFLVSSTMHTSPAGDGSDMQGDVYLGLKTADGGFLSRLELSGPGHFAFANQPNAVLASQTLPGLGSANPDTPGSSLIPDGEQGGWYTVQISSPLDPDITGYLGNGGPLALQPGPGVALPSGRDIAVNIAVMKIAHSLVLAPDLEVPWSAPNHGQLRVLAVELSAFNQIDDGGYDYLH
jgi:hypothetical protein